MNNKISVRWTSHLKDKDKDEFRNKIKASRRVLERLRELLDKELEVSIKEMRSSSNYHKPQWPLFMADKMAEQRVLQKVIDLLPIQEK